MSYLGNKDYYLEVVSGHVAGRRVRRALGYNAYILDVLTDVSELRVPVIPLPAGAIPMEVVSTSAEDSDTGTGAAVVEVHGLDGDWDEVSELVALDGLTPVVLLNDYQRLNNVHVMRLGSGAPVGGVAVGEITVRGLGEGAAYNRIAAGGNMTLQCHFTVPNSKTAYIIGWMAGGISVKKDTIVRLILRATVDWHNRSLLPGVYHFQDIVMVASTTIRHPFIPPLRVPSRCDVKVSAQRVLNGTGEAAATAAVEMVLIDN